MVAYSKHALIVLGLLPYLIHTTNGLTTHFPQRLSARKASPSFKIPLSIAASSNFDLPDVNPEKAKLRKYLDDLSGSIIWDNEENELFEKQLELKKQKTRKRMTEAWVNASLDTSSSSRKIGLVLAQVNEGQKLVPMENTENKYLLNLDTLQCRAFPESVKDVQTLINSRVDVRFSGVVVIAVDPKGQAYEQGIRPGDRLFASSATMGDNMWPKKTLEGLRSSMSSRKVVSSTMKLQFKRASVMAKTDNRYELDIVKPVGIEIEEDDEGYVVVTGFDDSASRLVRKGVRVGDRILAVESTLGGKLWPVSTVEGVISSWTVRLPGQKVTMQFERPLENLMKSSIGNTLVQRAKSLAAEAGIELQDMTLSPEKQQILWKRCQEVLQRYRKKEGFVGKYNIPGLVADKVTDAISSVSSSFDAQTLSMVMNAYNSCDQMDKALHVFEAAVGLKADGSTDTAAAVITGKDTGELLPNSDALGLYTLSAVLRAHAKKGNAVACKRIMGIMEGRSGTVIEDKTASRWSTVGTSFIPDITCYNIILSALAEAGEIKETLELFDSIGIGPNKFVKKNLVTYNTVIGALSNAGMSEEAFEVFSDLKEAGISADKYTYGCLVKACKQPQDMQELLWDMKDKGITPTIVTYNTMIKTLCKRLQWYDAKNLIADMEVSGIKPDSMTYGFLMGGLLKAGKYSASLTLFESACTDSYTVQLTENVHLYTTAIAAAAALNNNEKAFDLLKRMISVGVQPNTKTFTALQTACLSSGNPDLAVDVFRKIQNPDGRAMLVGLEAMCLEGHFEEVTSTLRDQWKTRGSALSGKQLMRGFEFLLRETLSQGDLLSARTCIQELLSMGFIPSKSIFGTIISALNMKPPRKTDLAFAPEIPEEHFEFLLFVMDSLSGRKLSCDAEFYTTLLLAGARMGGLKRRICALITESRIVSTEQRRTTSILSTSDDNLSQQEIGWENLLKDYDHHKDRMPVLPIVKLNFGKSQVRTVLLAEQQVTYNEGRTQKRRSEITANPSVIA